MLTGPVCHEALTPHGHVLSTALAAPRQARRWSGDSEALGRRPRPVSVHRAAAWSDPTWQKAPHCLKHGHTARGGDTTRCPLLAAQLPDLRPSHPSGQQMPICPPSFRSNTTSGGLSDLRPPPPSPHGGPHPGTRGSDGERGGRPNGTRSASRHRLHKPSSRSRFTHG